MALLGCVGSDPTLSPCLDFMGSCADLLEQPQVVDAFTRVEDGPFVDGGAFICTAFPADDNTIDTILSGLISFAVSWPVAVVVYICLGLSTATDVDQLHGRTRWLNWPTTYRFTMGKLRWRWSGAGAPPPGRLGRLKRFLASWWCSSIWVDGIVWFADRLVPCFCAHREEEEDADKDDEVESPDAAYEAAVDEAMLEWGQDVEGQRQFNQMTGNFKRAGYVILHLCWGVFAWITFAYGRLVYNLLGPAAARDFSNSWGIGVGLSQISDAQGVVTSAMQALLVRDALRSVHSITDSRLYLRSLRSWRRCGWSRTATGSSRTSTSSASKPPSSPGAPGSRRCWPNSSCRATQWHDPSTSALGHS